MFPISWVIIIPENQFALAILIETIRTGLLALKLQDVKNPP